MQKFSVLAEESGSFFIKASKTFAACLAPAFLAAKTFDCGSVVPVIFKSAYESYPDFVIFPQDISTILGRLSVADGSSGLSILSIVA